MEESQLSDRGQSKPYCLPFLLRLRAPLLRASCTVKHQFLGCSLSTCKATEVCAGVPRCGSGPAPGLSATPSLRRRIATAETRAWKEQERICCLLLVKLPTCFEDGHGQRGSIWAALFAGFLSQAWQTQCILSRLASGLKAPCTLPSTGNSAHHSFNLQSHWCGSQGSGHVVKLVHYKHNSVCMAGWRHGRCELKFICSAVAAGWLVLLQINGGEGVQTRCCGLPRHVSATFVCLPPRCAQAHNYLPKSSNASRTLPRIQSCSGGDLLINRSIHACSRRSSGA